MLVTHEVPSDWDVDVACAACGVAMPKPTTTECPGCHRTIGECCEEQRCEEGLHACPFCHTRLATCSDGSVKSGGE